MAAITVWVACCNHGLGGGYKTISRQTEGRPVAEMKGLTSKSNRYTQSLVMVDMSRRSNQVCLVGTEPQSIHYRRDAVESCELRDMVNLHQLTQWGGPGSGSAE